MTEFSNIIINTDNYKHCHYPLYPPGTEYVSSYIESRGGEFPVNMFVGLQAFIREFLMHPITLEDIDEAEFTEREQGMHFNRDNWLGILNDHGGYLPVEIEAVPEGTVLPVKNVLVQVINTGVSIAVQETFVDSATGVVCVSSTLYAPGNGAGGCCARCSRRACPCRGCGG